MRGWFPRLRPFSARFFAILLLVLTVGAYCYYYRTPPAPYRKNEMDRIDLKQPDFPREYRQNTMKEKCLPLTESKADIDTVKVYPNFEFQPSWVRTKEFWDVSFESRYEKMRKDEGQPTLKVFVVPHSHNDPGWLRTFEGYFEKYTKDIINNMVQKLQEHTNMTFIWTEISFLNAWWERTHPMKQKALKKLIKEGRVEITTGGWVMPDEACSHIYAIIDQFIEGHTWVKNNLGVIPKTGWSIDPFGHGPTVPYLLDKSGFKATIIQRIHYAWKQWLAKKQIQEFHWVTGWNSKKPSLVVHNQPFDIYSIKSTCGPHPSVCLSFDFRKIPGEYTEYSSKHEDITPQNLHSKSKTLIEEYRRIGTLTPHNVVLVPLGDDFRYEYTIEFDSQYKNYMKLFEYINANKKIFNAEVQFGTPLDYFKAVEERYDKIPSLKGDFFVYSDIFTEGRPAYWSGYYTTRPYLKILSRQLEHQLRTSEILFTLISNFMKQSSNLTCCLVSSVKRLEKSYEDLINARRNLGLFQHHDAITGTSKASVMFDYGNKMFMSLYHCMRLQEAALASIMIPNTKLHSQNVIQSEIEWETYGSPVKKMILSLIDKKTVILFNPLMEPRSEIVELTSNTTNIRIYDTLKKEYVQYQISPHIDILANGKRVISPNRFSVKFFASLPALSSVTFNLEHYTNKSNHAIVFCNNCHNGESELFSTRAMMPGDIQLENSMLKLLINRNTGFLRQIYRKDIKKRNNVEIQFAAYQSAQRHSGAYLFMPDYDSPEKLVLNDYANWNNVQDDNIIIVSGPVSTEITTMYLPFLINKISIYNVNDDALSRAVFVESVVDFESPPKNRETELFMRIHTDIQNGEPPEFYTDQNGFQYQKRVKIEKLGIEANYYPITTMAWIQDEETRLTLITDHAQGASAYEHGRLEVMLDRRTLYDDFRGVGEGIVDNKITTFRHWLLLESISDTKLHKRDIENLKNPKTMKERHFRPHHQDSVYQLPSQNADYLSRTLNYPVNVYYVDVSEVGEIEVNSHHIFAKALPPGLHLVTLRTITDEILEQFPSSSCLMVLQRPGYSCSIGYASHIKSTEFTTDSEFLDLHINNLTSVSLTGLKTYQSLSHLSEIELDPMEVKTYKINF